MHDLEDQKRDEPRGSILDITPEELAEFDEYHRQIEENKRREAKSDVAGRVRRERRALRRRIGFL